MLRFKDGVSLYGLQPEMLWALDRCVEAWEGDVTVTSARGDKHSVGSKHYSGYAVDLRTRDLNESQIRIILEALRFILHGYDVILESTHIHIEYDPKEPSEYMTKRNF